MGSYYYLYGRECPYCNVKQDEIMFFDNACDANGEYQGFDTHTCDKCKKKFKIYMDFVLDILE